MIWMKLFLEICYKKLVIIIVYQQKDVYNGRRNKYNLIDIDDVV